MSKLQTISADVLYYNTEWNPVQNIDVKFGMTVTEIATVLPI
nr:Uncharacterised protein [Escherichia coli]